MSRIGYTPVQIPEDVEVSVDDKNVVSAKGPQGELTQPVDPEIKVEVKDGEVHFDRPSDLKRHKAFHGLSRSLVEGLITGVKEGYKKELEIRGIGYRAKVQGQKITLKLGYSHDIVLGLPEGINASVDTEEEHPLVTIEGVNKELVGQVAAKIRAQRPPEPYKGKGIRYKGEEVKRKEGKVAAAVTGAGAGAE